MEFEYLITLKHDIAVITLTGDLDRDSKNKFEKLHQEVLSTNANLFIFYFKEITVIEHSIYKELTIIQHDIRKQKLDLCLFGLDLKMKNILIDKAIIRSTELKKDLVEALASRGKVVPV